MSLPIKRMWIVRSAILAQLALVHNTHRQTHIRKQV